MTEDTWGQIRQTLQKTVGKNNYTNWIEPLEFAGLADGVATFHVPTQFIGDWVSRNFADMILQALVSAGESVSRVVFEVAAGAARVIRPNVAEKPAVAKLPEDFVTGATLDARHTFDSFVVGKPNELAHAAARRVAEGGPVSFNPLFLYGGVGLGKTHLMHAIAHETCSAAARS